ncbi:MAG: hypothetical protein ACXWTP_13045 [Methylosarcina sp.]
MINKIASSIFTVLLFSIFSVQAKKINVSDVPALIIDGIKSSHPDAENIMVDQTLHFRSNLYQVKFKTKAAQHFALFDSQGRPFGQEEMINPLQLPMAVSRKLEKAFGDYTLLNSLIIKHADGRIEYEVNVKGNGSNWMLAMSPNGNILTKNLLEI